MCNIMSETPYALWPPTLLWEFSYRKILLLWYEAPCTYAWSQVSDVSTSPQQVLRMDNAGIQQRKHNKSVLAIAGIPQHVASNTHSQHMHPGRLTSELKNRLLQVSLEKHRLPLSRKMTHLFDAGSLEFRFLLMKNPALVRSLHRAVSSTASTHFRVGSGAPWVWAKWRRTFRSSQAALEVAARIYSTCMKRLEMPGDINAVCFFFEENVWH